MNSIVLSADMLFERTHSGQDSDGWFGNHNTEPCSILLWCRFVCGRPTNLQICFADQNKQKIFLCRIVMQLNPFCFLFSSLALMSVKNWIFFCFYCLLCFLSMNTSSELSGSLPVSLSLSPNWRELITLSLTPLRRDTKQSTTSLSDLYLELHSDKSRSHTHTLTHTLTLTVEVNSL